MKNISTYQEIFSQGNGTRYQSPHKEDLEGLLFFPPWRQFPDLNYVPEEGGFFIISQIQVPHTGSRSLVEEISKSNTSSGI